MNDGKIRVVASAVSLKTSSFVRDPGLTSALYIVMEKKGNDYIVDPAHREGLAKKLEGIHSTIFEPSKVIPKEWEPHFTDYFRIDEEWVINTVSADIVGAMRKI